MSVAVGVWIAVLVGSIGGIVVGLITEYYTGGGPVEKIAKDGETGSATVLISGLATGMQSVAIPVLTIVFIIFISIKEKPELSSKTNLISFRLFIIIFLAILLF